MINKFRIAMILLLSTFFSYAAEPDKSMPTMAPILKNAMPAIVNVAEDANLVATVDVPSSVPLNTALWTSLNDLVTDPKV